MNLPIINTSGFQALRRRYGLGSGSRGLNLIHSAAHFPTLIVFVSDTQRYQDFLESDVYNYELQDQEINADGTRKRFPKPFDIHGPVGTNLKVLNAMTASNYRLPTILIAKLGHNQWSELFCDCVLTGWSQRDHDGKPFFHIERTRVPYFLLGPSDEHEEEE